MKLAYYNLKSRLFIVVIMVVTFTFSGYGTNPFELPENIHYSFKVSCDQPGHHYFHVEMTCTGQQSEYIDFKMPVWTPGYYSVQNLSKNVVNFKATNPAGLSLPFDKTRKNCWRVNSKDESVVIISYEVYAPELSVVGSYLGIDQAFISPTGLFFYPDGQIGQSSLVTFNLNKDWKTVSTGLDVVEGRPNTFFASNFDVLFDCPVLIGNQQELHFIVKGIPHTLAVSEKDTSDKTRFVSDLTKVVETATSLIGDIPYTHYTFLTIGSYRGGMEHSNSCALSCRGLVCDTSNLDSYKEWLSFVTHEYFHLFNVKRIRPIVLGPFDYDNECYTDMLWFSEGCTVYYEYIILNKAGLFNREDCYKYLTESITGFENRQGHLMETAALSGFDAWIHYFNPNDDAENNTISYYDKGCTIGFLLDMKIRGASQGKKSLDDVMRGLYYTYHVGLKRGFTDEEFRSMCDKIAGVPLDEIFSYVKTLKPIDYPKYLSLAGLTIDTTAHQVEGSAYFGAKIKSENGECKLYNVEKNSPVWNAGLGNDCIVLTLEGQKADHETFRSVINTKKAGEIVHLTISVDEKPVAVDVLLTPLIERSFKISEATDAPTAVQSIRNSWLQ